MQILIGCAKTMTSDGKAELRREQRPKFMDISERLAGELAGYSPEELGRILNVNNEIARENWLRYQEFFDVSARVPAIFGYDGTVFRKLAPESMRKEDLEYADEHLFIGSFLYGLLRPLDSISLYRLEGNVELPAAGLRSLFDFWKPILTDWFIERVKADDGVLVNLASNEFRHIFDWKRVRKELTVVSPEFKVDKGGTLRTVVVYAKMCRGAMTRWIIENRIKEVSDLRGFSYEGFCYEGNWQFNMR